MIQRRSFLTAMLAAAAAPAFVRAGVLMPVRELWLPTVWGDGMHDDTEGLQAAIDGRPFKNKGRATVIPAVAGVGLKIIGGDFKLSDTLVISDFKDAEVSSCALSWAPSDGTRPGAMMYFRDGDGAYIGNVNINSRGGIF